MKRIISAAATAVLLIIGLSAAPAAAGGIRKAVAAKPMPRKVSYRDLDLNTEAGARALRKRVSSAAYGVCTTDQYGRFIGPGAADRQACQVEVMTGLEPKLATLVRSVRVIAARGGDTKALLAASSISVGR